MIMMNPWLFVPKTCPKPKIYHPKPQPQNPEIQRQISSRTNAPAPNNDNISYNKLKFYNCRWLDAGLLHMITFSTGMRTTPIVTEWYMRRGERSLGRSIEVVTTGTILITLEMSMRTRLGCWDIMLRYAESCFCDNKNTVYRSQNDCLTVFIFCKFYLTMSYGLMNLIWPLHVLEIAYLCNYAGIGHQGSRFFGLPYVLVLVVRKLART